MNPPDAIVGAEGSGGRDRHRPESRRTPDRRDVLLAGGFGLGAIGLGALAGGVSAEAQTSPPDMGGTSVVELAGKGIDPSGTSSSSAGVQAVLDGAGDGATVVVPSGAVLRLTRTVTIRRRIVLAGSGELRFVDGIEHVPAIHVVADGAEVRDVRLSNPRLLGSPTGDKSYGILIDAHDVVVRGVVVQSFQTGIAVSPFGEWRGARIVENTVLDVLGTGGGPNSGSSLGEDRGDGIVVWGAEAVVAANHVRAASGRDCRVGIHVENLGTYERRTDARADSMVSVAGNIVTGPFRRGIAAEGMTAVSIVGNSVSDSTWWAIAIIFGETCSVTGNTVLWTRPPDALQGNAFNPARAAIVLRGDGVGHVVSGNTVRISGAADHAIHLQSQGDGAADAVVSSNSCTVAVGGTCGTGIRVDDASHGTIESNNLSGFSGAGIACSSCVEVSVSGNGLRGGGAGTGVQLSGPASSAQITGNRVSDVATGVTVDPDWVVSVTGNVFSRIGSGLVLDRARAALVSANVFHGVDARLGSLPRGSVQTGNLGVA